METLFGVVSEVVDDKKFVIKFSIEGVIEDHVAYPIDTFDELNVGDPIFIYVIDSIFGYNFVYKKVRLYDHTRMKLLDSLIDIHDDHIEIHTGKDDEQKVTIMINGDGTISVKSKDDITVECEKDISVKCKNATVKADSSIKIQSPDTSLASGSSGKLSAGKMGVVTPAIQGPFCGIPTCPLTGAPHAGNEVNNN